MGKANLQKKKKMKSPKDKVTYDCRPVLFGPRGLAFVGMTLGKGPSQKSSGKGGSFVPH